MSALVVVIAAVVGSGWGVAAAYLRRHRLWLPLVLGSLVYVAVLAWAWLDEGSGFAVAALAVGLAASYALSDVAIRPRRQTVD